MADKGTLFFRIIISEEEVQPLKEMKTEDGPFFPEGEA